MDLFAVDQPEPRRYFITLSPRWTAVVLVPPDGDVAMGMFLDGELSWWMDGAAGEA